MTSTIPNRFFLVSRGSISVNLRFGVSFIGKKLVTSFGVDRLGWSLGLGIDRDVGKVQVRDRGLDLTEVVIKAVSKGATKLF